MAAGQCASDSGCVGACTRSCVQRTAGGSWSLGILAAVAIAAAAAGIWACGKFRRRRFLNTRGLTPINTRSDQRDRMRAAYSRRAAHQGMGLSTAVSAVGCCRSASTDCN